MLSNFYANITIISLNSNPHAKICINFATAIPIKKIFVFFIDSYFITRINDEANHIFVNNS